MILQFYASYLRCFVGVFLLNFVQRTLYESPRWLFPLPSLGYIAHRYVCNGSNAAEITPNFPPGRVSTKQRVRCCLMMASRLRCSLMITPSWGSLRIPKREVSRLYYREPKAERIGKDLTRPLANIGVQASQPSLRWQIIS